MKLYSISLMGNLHEARQWLNTDRRLVEYLFSIQDVGGGVIAIFRLSDVDEQIDFERDFKVS